MNSFTRRVRNRFDAFRFSPGRGEAAMQLLLREHYQDQTAPLAQSISDYGFSVYSQTDEDGILLYLTARVGAPNRTAVEIGAGDGIECNTANLILNHGWHALLVDGDSEKVERGRAFYTHARQTRIYPPAFAHQWITRGAVNATVESHGFRREVDLLSIDVDGVDYWIWEALTSITPRIVVIEYQDILGPDRSWSVPYSDHFSAAEYPMTGAMPNFAGASLRAFVNLGKKKGYRLVGVNRYGYNAFFVRDDLAPGLVPEIQVESCFSHPKTIEGMRMRFPTVEHMPWVEV